MRERWLVGYVGDGVLLLCWYLHSRYQRRLITGEMRRIAKERNALHGEKLGKKINSGWAR